MLSDGRRKTYFDFNVFMDFLMVIYFILKSGFHKTTIPLVFEYYEIFARCCVIGLSMFKFYLYFTDTIFIL